MKTLILLLCLASSLRAEVLKREGGQFVLTKGTFKISELLADYVKHENLNLNQIDLQDESFTQQGKKGIPEAKIEKYVSTLLARSGNAMVRMPGTNFLSVFQAREGRFATLPVYTKAEDLPDNENLVQFTYTLKHIEASDLARNMRPFMGRYGRVIDIQHAESIIIADNATNVRRHVRLIKEMDTEEFAKSKKEIDELNEKHKKILTKEKSWYEIFKENTGVLFVVFLLFGLIFGFGARGFMMKRIEGGW